MHRITTLAALPLLAVVGMSAQQAYTITADIPGIKPDYEVELVNNDMTRQVGWDRVAGTAGDGTFTISGTVDMPTLCEIRIKPKEDGTISRVIDLMVENMPIEVSAAHFDSIPPSFYAGTSGMYQKRNIKIRAGEAQKEYEQYFEYIFPYEEAAKQAHSDLYWAGRNWNEQERDSLEKAMNSAIMAATSAGTVFMNEHPAYHISALLWQKTLAAPFVYTAEELDGIWEKVAGNNSPARRDALAKVIETARKFVRGQQYTDFKAVDPQGGEHKASELIGTGRWTLVDVWASWCMPCRAAIPHVRELHEKYGDRLNIIAASVDENPAAWTKAMEQEKMTWTQLRIPQEIYREVAAAYNIGGIPFLLLIDPQGRIVSAGHDPVKVETILAESL